MILERISSTAPLEGAHTCTFLIFLSERTIAMMPVIVEVFPVPGGP